MHKQKDQRYTHIDHRRLTIKPTSELFHQTWNSVPKSLTPCPPNLLKYYIKNRNMSTRMKNQVEVITTNSNRHFEILLWNQDTDTNVSKPILEYYKLLWIEECLLNAYMLIQLKCST